MNIQLDSVVTSEKVDLLSEAYVRFQEKMFRSAGTVVDNRLDAIIDLCRENLHANGLAAIQMPTISGNRVALTTRLLHTSGQFMQFFTQFPLDQSLSVVEVGYVLTELRKQVLVSLAGLSVDEGEINTHF